MSGLPIRTVVTGKLNFQLHLNGLKMAISYIIKCHYMELPKYSDVVDLSVPVPRKKSRDTWRDEHAVPL